MCDNFLFINYCYLKFLQAIENDEVNEFKTAVEAMKGTTVPREHCLNVCKMVTLTGLGDRPTHHPMTLLAFAGYYARFDVLEHLISTQARKYSKHHYRFQFNFS